MGLWRSGKLSMNEKKKEKRKEKEVKNDLEC